MNSNVNGLWPYQSRQFSYNLQLPQIYINTDLCKTIRNTPWPPDLPQYRSKQLHWSQRSRKSNELPSQQTGYIENNVSSRLLHPWAPVAPCLGPLQVRNPPEQAASVILVQDTPGWTSGHMASHLAPTSASTLGWHQQTLFFSPMALYLAWSSGSRTSDPPKTALPSDNYQDKPKFWDLNSLNGLDKGLDTPVQPVRADPMI